MKKLNLNAAQAIDSLTDFIKSTVNNAGFSKVVLGISGGVDSSLSAFLSVQALGEKNVLALCMPYKTSSPESLEHAKLVIEQLRVPSLTIDISEAVDAVLLNYPDASLVRRGNVMARIRMINIYDQSAAFPGLVVGTGNKTESLLGYSTLHGDGAFDFNPLADLYKAQVRQLAAEIGVPQSIIEKPPSADLWVGQTDEEELGFTYDEMDRLLYALVEEGLSSGECLKAGFSEEFVQNIISRVKKYRFKSTLPLVGSVGQYPLVELEQLPAFADRN
jgi:NAD+ synthase